MNCPSCGKAIRPEESVCPYCGSTIRQPAGTPAPEEINVSELRRHSRELEELLGYTPSAVRTGARLVILSVFGFVFTAFAIFFIVVSKGEGAPRVFRLFPLIFVLVGVVMMGGGIRGLVKLTTSPLERLPAAVVGKRQHYSSSSQGSGTTSYYLTIETEDGQRKEHSVRGRLYGQVERGDAGVAYLRGGYLLDFRRVRLKNG
jgi:hypothetical protein